MYSTLYTARQKQDTYLPRKWYVEDASRLPWVRSLTIKVSDKINKLNLRGMIFPENLLSTGGMVSYDYRILLADGMTPDWERFVTIKEIMHCYFPPLAETAKYATSNQIALDNHMRSFFTQSGARSVQADLDREARWLALGVICTEHDRNGFIRTTKDGALDVAAKVAEKMRVPIGQAKQLLSSQLENEISGSL